MLRLIGATRLQSTLITKSSLPLIPINNDLVTLEKQDTLLKKRNKLLKQTIPLKKFKPISPSLRWLRYPVYDYLHKGKPIKSLTTTWKNKSGRNNQGVITVRHRGGGHKKRIRLVDFNRLSPYIQDVVRIEYDPIRTAHIALLKDSITQKLSYIIAPDGLRAGDKIRSFRYLSLNKQGDFIFNEDGTILRKPYSSNKTSTNNNINNINNINNNDTQENELELKTIIEPNEKEKITQTNKQYQDIEVINETANETKAQIESKKNILDFLPQEIESVNDFPLKFIIRGNCLPLNLIPIGTIIHNISLTSQGHSKLCRSAGCYGRLMTKLPEKNRAVVKLQSGEHRYVSLNSCATIGIVSNINHQLKSLGKAGRSRWLNRRPRVRGVAMNKVDHPHGGGRGKSKSNKLSMSPWGQLAKGYKTRRGKNQNHLKVKDRRM